MKKVLKIIGIILLALIVLVLALLIYFFRKPAVPGKYWEAVETGGAIEERFLTEGAYEVGYIEQAAAQNYKKYEIYYPKELESKEGKYPVIVVNNGTGIPASKYPAVLKHLASWGFIVIATEEEYSWNGFGANMSLKFLLREDESEDSIFYQKIDRDNIGAVGHSQGGVGAVNAVTDAEYGNLYKTVVLESPTHTELAGALEWDYDISRVDIPCLMVAGTEKGDAELVIPLEQMNRMFDEISLAPVKAMARRRGTDHGYMLYQADGYVTAWFMWQLQGDEDAARAFTGESAELLDNALWSDQRIESRKD